MITLLFVLGCVVSLFACFFLVKSADEKLIALSLQEQLKLNQETTDSSEKQEAKKENH